MNEQTVFHPNVDCFDQLRLPASDAYLMPGIQWGQFNCLFTPAYWAAQAWMEGNAYPQNRHKLGDNLLEETVACVIGGHGMPAEICLSAYRRIKESKVLSATSAIGETEYYHLLAAPFVKQNGQAIRYRFARQKARYLAKIHLAFINVSPPDDAVMLRAWLLALPGIGPKTASWIVRNHKDSDQVAILDIHIYRAGLLSGFFDSSLKIERHYATMERRFLEFAHAINVRPSVLDAIMWAHMRSAPTIVRNLLQVKVGQVDQQALLSSERRRFLKHSDETAANPDYRT